MSTEKPLEAGDADEVRGGDGYYQVQFKDATVSNIQFPK